jgi:EmrB/QacA subfamily drug resistance transporter
VTRQRTVLITIAVMMSLFMASMEATVIATAMPTIVSELGGLESFSWVFAIYMLTSTIAGPIFGKLSDMIGRRPVYFVAIGMFTLGSLLCGLAPTMPALIAARAVQGIGAGGLQPLAFIIIGDIFTLEQRARIQGLFSGVWGVSSVIGPLLGGLIVDVASWHWVFLINLVPAAAAALLFNAGWRDAARRDGPRPRIDYAGAGLLAGGVALLLLGLDHPTTPSGLALLAGSAVVLVLLVIVELRAEAPILPVTLFRDRLFAVACAQGILAGSVLFGSVNYIPLYVQTVLGSSATEAGSTITPMMLGWVFTSIIAGRLLLLVNYRNLVVTGMSLFAVGAFLLSRIRPEMSRFELALAVALMGIGMGASIPSFLISVQSSVARSSLGTATSTLTFSRTIGGAIGVATLGGILANRIVSELAARGLPADAIDLAALIDSHSSSAVSLAAGPTEALAAAMGATFAAPFVIALLAFAAVLFAPHLTVAQLKAARAANHQPAPAAAQD